MIFTIEISHYPLVEDYEEEILTFITHLKNLEDVIVVTNAMSTQVKGEHNIVLAEIGKIIASLGDKTSSTILKIIPRDLPIESGIISV
jgi:uncharacterized protein YqgV (UPF0045/DUF77 family)